MYKYIGRFIYKWLNVEVKYKGNYNKDNRWLLNYNIQTIIDVGANEGQFAKKFRRLFPTAFIHSFEPIKAEFNKLNQNFAGDRNFKAYELGIGEKNETKTFHVNSNTASSSFLSLKGHENHFANAKEESEMEMQIQTLDSVFKDQPLNTPILLKIDVQGFEDKVLAGSKELLKKVKIILIEVSFVRLYNEQPLFNDIYSILTQQGFSYAGSYEQLFSPADNSVLQADAIFIKN